MKPTMAESKGPIAETRVTPAPIDRVRPLQPAKYIVAPLASRFLAVLIGMLLASSTLFPLSLLFDLNPLNRVIRIEVLLFLLTW
ncbi:MAG: hypothetical protein ACXV3U_01630 [Halobacteriota archaeon]